MGSVQNPALDLFYARFAYIGITMKQMLLLSHNTVVLVYVT